MKKYQADYTIIGAGIAGMVIELLDAGQKVPLLDRDIEKKMGCLVKLSFGGMYYVNPLIQRKRDIHDHPGIVLKDWFSVAEFEETDVLPKK